MLLAWGNRTLGVRPGRRASVRPKRAMLESQDARNSDVLSKWAGEAIVWAE